MCLAYITQSIGFDTNTGALGHQGIRRVVAVYSQPSSERTTGLIRTHTNSCLSLKWLNLFEYLDNIFQIEINYEDFNLSNVTKQVIMRCSITLEAGVFAEPFFTRRYSLVYGRQVLEDIDIM